MIKYQGLNIRLDELTSEQQLKIIWIINSIASHRYSKEMDAFINSKIEKLKLDLDDGMYSLL
jgi:hypothetical protein